MSLDKAILHGKEKRRPYRGSKAIDPSCRNHGDCPVCRENRLHKFRDKHPMMKEDIIVTDEEYLFKQTEIERKKLGYGDKHKKRQGGRYVRLPSDNLTKKEREAMNGDVKTWKEKPYYTWDEFRALPDDVALKWVNSLINRYACGMGVISQCVLGKGQMDLHHYMLKKGLREYVNKGGTGVVAARGKARLLEDIEEYQRSLTPVHPTMEEEASVTETEETAAPEPITEFAAKPVYDTKAEEPIMTAKVGDLHNIALLLKSLAGTGARLTIEVTL